MKCLCFLLAFLPVAEHQTASKIVSWQGLLLSCQLKDPSKCSCLTWVLKPLASWLLGVSWGSSHSLEAVYQNKGHGKQLEVIKFLSAKQQPSQMMTDQARKYLSISPWKLFPLLDNLPSDGFAVALVSVTCSFQLKRPRRPPGLLVSHVCIVPLSDKSWVTWSCWSMTWSRGPADMVEGYPSFFAL